MKEKNKQEEEILNLAFKEGWGFGDPEAKFQYIMQVSIVLARRVETLNQRMEKLTQRLLWLTWFSVVPSFVVGLDVVLKWIHVTI